jgi:hypothetical protein
MHQITIIYTNMLFSSNSLDYNEQFLKVIVDFKSTKNYELITRTDKLKLKIVRR